MKMQEYLKKNGILFIVTFIIILLIIVASIILFNKKENNKNVVEEQELKVTYNINKDLKYPMTKESGEANASISTISIKNNKNKTVNYKLVVKELDDSTLKLNRVYYNINNETKVIPDDKVLYEGTINANEEISLEFKIWIGLELLQSEDTNNYLNLSYEIINE